jgi:hypothetical protein
VVGMTYRYRECACGRTSGLYISQENIVYSGRYAVPLGITNDSLHDASINIPLDGRGVPLNAYVMAQYCCSALKVKNAKKYAREYDELDLFFKDIQLKWNMTKVVDNIRIKNPFLKLIYKFFSKYILIRVPEETDEEQSKKRAMLLKNITDEE